MTEPLALEMSGDSALDFVEALGDLSIVGWDASTMEIEAGDDSATVEHEEGTVHVRLGGVALVKVPRDSNLTFASVLGDVRIQGINGEISGGMVAGDLALEGVGSVRCNTIAGSLWARDVSGLLQVRRVGGDADIAGIDGDVIGLVVGADLVLADVVGDVEAQVGADAVVRLSPAAGRQYSVAAGADLRCVLPPDAGLEIDAAGGAGVRSDFASDPLGHHWSGTLGEGGATATLRAGAGLSIESTERDDAERGKGQPGRDAADVGVDFTNDLGRWAEDFSQRMRDHAMSMADQMAERLGRVAETLPDVLVAAGMSSDEADRIAMRVQRSAERASEQVERSMREAARRVERTASRVESRAARKAERAAWHAGRAGRHAERHAERRASWHAAGGARPSDRVTQEERLAVLRMVEQGKISVDDAARLMAALEGRST